ncbi:sortase [Streptomyces sp. NBC_00162]|uniref:sortase n=1 Tax=Streptomyces sp. NBC_00162 TaxID=2903629 RepID=UPI00214BE7E5|nr:sortase [Streptomyces sp. NBC_00162]UUU41961.1 sortase [Streptomyces sp. NBC_00162]
MTRRDWPYAGEVRCEHRDHLHADPDADPHAHPLGLHVPHPHVHDERWLRGGRLHHGHGGRYGHERGYGGGHERGYECGYGHGHGRQGWPRRHRHRRHHPRTDRRGPGPELRDKLANVTAPVGPTEAGAPVALLAIPQIGVREVVREATTADVLASGPGHRRDTVLPGQPGTSILMGRQAGYGGPFGHIGDLERGETFTVTTGQGEHEYRVLGVRRAGDPQPAKPTGDAGLLILMTGDGTPYMPRGVLQVDAELLSPAQQSGGRTPGRLAAEEAPMAGQASAWVPLILWGQALLLAAAALAWARVRWGRAHTWLVGFPVLAALALAVSDQAALLLPSLL